MPTHKINNQNNVFSTVKLHAELVGKGFSREIVSNDGSSCLCFSSQVMRCVCQAACLPSSNPF